jgi:hypothetical protein
MDNSRLPRKGQFFLVKNEEHNSEYGLIIRSCSFEALSHSFRKQ